MVVKSVVQSKEKKAAKEGAPAAPEKKRATRSKHQVETYSVYIYRVLKQVHPEIGVSKRSMSIMNSFINDVFERICGEA